jgi:hypothetical protein
MALSTAQPGAAPKTVTPVESTRGLRTCMNMSGLSLERKLEMRKAATDLLESVRGFTDTPVTAGMEDTIALAKSVLEQTAHLEKDEKRDEFITMKMLLCFKSLRRQDPEKLQPDMGWMSCLLETARAAGLEYDATAYLEKEPS